MIFIEESSKRVGSRQEERKTKLTGDGSRSCELSLPPSPFPLPTPNFQLPTFLPPDPPIPHTRESSSDRLVGSGNERQNVERALPKEPYRIRIRRTGGGDTRERLGCHPSGRSLGRTLFVRGSSLVFRPTSRANHNQRTKNEERRTSRQSLIHEVHRTKTIFVAKDDRSGGSGS